MLTDNMIGKIAALDTAVHNPARLMIVCMLIRQSEIDYLVLMERTALTSGNITTHLNKLATSGYITIRKSFKGKRPNTSVSLTDAGRKAYARWGETIVLALPDNAIRQVNARLLSSIVEQRGRLSYSELFPPEWQHFASLPDQLFRGFNLPPVQTLNCI